MAKRFGDGAGPPLNSQDETTPLLSGPERTPAHGTTDALDVPANSAGNAVGEEQVEDEDEDRPLPRGQIFLLSLSSVVEPIAFFGIFPYINFMIENVGNVDKEEVGLYSGLIESLFSATQMSVMILWGKASDRYGRKPILVTSLLGVAVATTLFGMSQTLWQMIVARCFAGIFAGTVVTIRSMLSENSTKHTQARAFSYFAFARNMGLFIGPLIGGALERPATKFPGTFGKIQFFHDYPYALPGLVTSAISLTTAVTSLLFVKETLHTSASTKKSSHPPMSTWTLLKSPGVARVVLIYNYVMGLAYTFTAVNPVYFYTPINLGGAGFSPELIAAATALSGGSQAIWLLLAFPALHKRVGTEGILWICGCVWPVFFASNVLFNVFLRYDLRALFWSTAPVTLAVGSGLAMAFTAVQLAVNDVAPSPATLGTLNAIVLAFSSGIRAVAPALATSIYAIGVKYHILYGHLFWAFSVIQGLGLLVLLRSLPQQVKTKAHEEDDEET